ncbi:23S rRNA pseudouridine synthase F [Endozoicomonas sp. (ex Bugula neritina AB1)]|nr:23S rRNA pseudouridine synthase F [Endozoicomonas sp. (ex Bugula neritina AB1)]
MIRLAKYIADAGHCSRRAACRLIESGEVLVNERSATHTDRVTDQDIIVVQGQSLQPREAFSYFLYNKPVGVDCVCNSNDPSSIIHVLPTAHNISRLFPVGRLDKDSHGLMLLTNHGDLCQRILHPDFYHEKVYRVTVNKPYDEEFCCQMASGVQYAQVTTKPCMIQRIDDHRFLLTLTQGLNRQIRKMCKALSYKVIDLQRIQLLNIHLGELPVNQHRPLTEGEILELLKGYGIPKE